MSRKSFINRQILKARLLRHVRGVQAANPTERHSVPFVMREEPMIYSLKYSVGNRSTSVTAFRDKRYRSMLKCWFRYYNDHKTPVVILVRFYVSPLSYVKIDKKTLREEKTPAMRSHEMADYLLSLMQMLHMTLFGCYRQIVKVDCEKYYSDSPRTVLQFMSWNAYVKLLQDNNTAQAVTESLRPTGKIRRIQSPKKRREGNASGNSATNGAPKEA